MCGWPGRGREGGVRGRRRGGRTWWPWRPPPSSSRTACSRGRGGHSGSALGGMRWVGAPRMVSTCARATPISPRHRPRPPASPDPGHVITRCTIDPNVNSVAAAKLASAPGGGRGIAGGFAGGAGQGMASGWVAGAGALPPALSLSPTTSSKGGGKPAARKGARVPLPPRQTPPPTTTTNASHPSPVRRSTRGIPPAPPACGACRGRDAPACPRPRPPGRLQGGGVGGYVGERGGRGWVGWSVGERGGLVRG